MAAPVKVARQQTTPELSGTFRTLPPEPTPAYTGTLRNLPEPSGTCLRNLHRFTPELSGTFRNLPRELTPCYKGTLRNLPEPASRTYTSTLRNSPKSSGTLRNLPEPASGTYTILQRNFPEPSGTRLRNLHQHTPELPKSSGTLRNLPEPASGTYTILQRNSPEPSGTRLRNLHQHTPELSEIFRNLPELASVTYTILHRNSPEPSGTCLGNLHHFTKELSGTFRNLPPEPTPAHSGTLRNLPEPSSGTGSCDPHRHTPELIWAEDPISLRCWGIKNYSTFLFLLTQLLEKVVWIEALGYKPLGLDCSQCLANAHKSSHICSPLQSPGPEISNRRCGLLPLELQKLKFLCVVCLLSLLPHQEFFSWQSKIILLKRFVLQHTDITVIVYHIMSFEMMWPSALQIVQYNAFLSQYPLNPNSSVDYKRLGCSISIRQQLNTFGLRTAKMPLPLQTSAWKSSLQPLYKLHPD